MSIVPISLALRGIFGRARHVLDPGNFFNYRGQKVEAVSIWGKAQLGRAGKLIVLLRKGTTQGELYQPGGTATSTLPLVAFNVAYGKPWHKVFTRAVGQVLGSLGDELEHDRLPLRGPDDDEADAPAECFVRVAPSLTPPATPRVVTERAIEVTLRYHRRIDTSPLSTYCLVVTPGTRRE